MRAPSSFIRRTSSVRSHQVRLQHHADVAVALPPDRLEDLQRDVGVRRVLHVDAHEEAVLGRRIEDAAQVVDAGRAIDVEAELRQLERHVALDARSRRWRRGCGGSRASRRRPLPPSRRSRRDSRASGAGRVSARPRTAATASSTDSPAMNRRANPPRRHAVARRQPLAGIRSVRGSEKGPSTSRRASVGRTRWARAGARIDRA